MLSPAAPTALQALHVQKQAPGENHKETQSSRWDFAIASPSTLTPIALHSWLHMKSLWANSNKPSQLGPQLPKILQSHRAQHIEDQLHIGFMAHSHSSQLPTMMSFTVVRCLTHSCTAGPPLKDTPNPHHRQVLTLLKKAVTRGEQTLQPVGYTPHGKSYIPHAQYVHLPPQNKLWYKVSRYLCSDFPRDNGFPNKLDAALHLFSIGEKRETINLETNQEWDRAQKKMKSEGEQGRLIIKAYPFEATITYMLFPLAAAILQSFIKIASLQRNYLKERSNRFFRTNENKPPRNRSYFLSQTGVL